jgi:hypothetical protein
LFGKTYGVFNQDGTSPYSIRSPCNTGDTALSLYFDIDTNTGVIDDITAGIEPNSVMGNLAVKFTGDTPNTNLITSNLLCFDNP